MFGRRVAAETVALRGGGAPPPYGSQTARQKVAPGDSWLVTVAVGPFRVTVALEVQVFRLGEVWSW